MECLGEEPKAGKWKGTGDFSRKKNGKIEQ